MNPLKQLENLGQSIWLDMIQRSMLRSGELKRMIDEAGLGGLTSNPTIFEKAIGHSTDYDEQISQISKGGATRDDVYDAVVIDDIAAAADLFRPIYDKTQGADGFVSLEVSPLLAHDTERTQAEARRLHGKLKRPNVMIKVPATPEGLPAIEQLISEGINVNVTLIFSVDVYNKVAEAYIRGLERRNEAGKPLTGIGSVASFFVSRIDTAVDKELQKKIDAGNSAAKALIGKAAIANAKLAYESFEKIFGSERFAKLKAKGARVQRPLWASTSTKNPAYSDVMYVEALIGPDTVDTAPKPTIEAYADHGKPQVTLTQDVQQAHQLFADLANAGIDFKKITEQLTADGVKSFADSFVQLMAAIDKKSGTAAATMAANRHTAELGQYASQAQTEFDLLIKQNAAQKVWNKDAAFWSSSADAQKIISNALGWLTVPKLMNERVDELAKFAEEIRAEGFTHVVVLGMGGSSLCPEVFSRTFGKRQGWPELHVVDSTVPATVRRIEKSLDLKKTLFIVSSKSGSTTEPVMFHRYFYGRVKQVSGAENAGRQFIAITDPGTQMVADAQRDKFRKIFLNMADIGGRYSALSYFGLVPFAVSGGDVKEFLSRTLKAVANCGASAPQEANIGLRMGAEIGVLAKAGRDKLTLITSSAIESVGLWIEQLIAESTGKEGKGIVPIEGEELGAPEVYGKDRVFFYVGVGEPTADVALKLSALQKAGHPVLKNVLSDALDLGAEFFFWEFATAIAGHVLGINPFDQPNVQESKDNTKRILGEFTNTKSMPKLRTIAEDGGVKVEADEKNAKAVAQKEFRAVIAAHLDRVKPGDYIAITQYFDETSAHDELVQKIRLTLRDETKCATTTGYGPRFLHSTGQLHKGGSDTGVFLQLTAADSPDVPLPGEAFTFGVLKEAQALGDFESLAKRGRRAIRVELGSNLTAGLEELLEAVSSRAKANV
jgi:transaldolase / glucose-6-phosphate isomerase